MEKYGSQTTEVEALLEKVKTITPEQAETLAIVWERSYNCADEWDEVVITCLAVSLISTVSIETIITFIAISYNLNAHYSSFNPAKTRVS